MSATDSLQPLWNGFQYFPHQVEGIHWMLQKEINGTLVDARKPSEPPVLVRGGFQCDDMGLGKTIQIVATMTPHPLPLTVLLAPLAMIDTWTQVCQRAGLSVFQAVGGEWFPVSPSSSSSSSVYITNFEKVYTTPRLFRHLVIDRVVLDEAHKIRNPDGQMAIYARRLGSKTNPIRWAVTGTPLVNSWKDVVSLLAFIGVPYSPLWKWEQRYIDVLPDLVLHRSLHSLRSLLPSAPPLPVIHHLSLPFHSPQEKEFYLAIQNSVIVQATGSSTPDMDTLTPQQAFLLLLRLRQLSVHPQLYISAKRRQSPNYIRKDWTEPSTKLLAIRDILLTDFPSHKMSLHLSLPQLHQEKESLHQEKESQELQEESQELQELQELQEEKEEPHRYLIFCQFIDEMDIIRDYLLSLGLFTELDILLYHGGLTLLEREDVLRRSKQSIRPTVMLLQLQAGGVGLNLQEYDRIIFVSPWWTSALMDQAIARAVRMGQTRTVHVYHLQLLIETQEQSVLLIDSLVYGKAEEKRAMLEEFFRISHDG
jgi:SNF2 family DNA or RNA helicase